MQPPKSCYHQHTNIPPISKPPHTGLLSSHSQSESVVPHKTKEQMPKYPHHVGGWSPPLHKPTVGNKKGETTTTGNKRKTVAAPLTSPITTSLPANAGINK